MHRVQYRKCTEYSTEYVSEYSKQGNWPTRSTPKQLRIKADVTAEHCIEGTDNS